MLKEFERKETEDKKVLNAEIKKIRERLLGQQQLLRDAKLPVLVLIEGWAAGTLSFPVSVRDSYPGKRENHVP